MKYKGVYQNNAKDCGVACLLSIIKYYKGSNTFENIRYLTKCNNNGITALNLVEASKKLGFESRGLKCNYEDLYNLHLPLICHIVLDNGYNHYIVLHKVKDKNVVVFDPYYGVKKYSKSEFLKIWDNIVIELKPVRKLDYIKEDNLYYLRNIISLSKIPYFIVIISSFLSIILTIISNYYLSALLDFNNVLYVFIFFTLVVIIKEINNLFHYNTLIKLENKVLEILNLETHKKLLSLPYYYFNSRCSGDISTKFNDLEYVKNFMIKVPISLFIDITLIIFSSFILSNINLTLFLVFLIACIFYLLVVVLSNNKIKKLVEINQECNSNKNVVLYENINCIDTIKNMNVKNLRHNIFTNVYKEYLNSCKNYEKYYFKINFIKNIILLVSINLILYIGMNLVRNGILLLSDLILFNSLLIYIAEPLNEIYESIPVIKNGINAIRRVGEIYSIKISNNKEIPRSYDVKFNNLNFSYDGYRNVLKNINYEIKFKDKVIVVGDSGCGKSTLFKLLSNMYEMEDGEILIGNCSINNVDITDIVTYVSEDEKLFNDTLRNNIVLNNNYDKLDDILNITRVKDIIFKKNIKLDSILEEGGTNLSKGEKQKIILARALLKNSKILILDESLSGVEENEEHIIMKNILQWCKDMTIIYISHSKVCLSMFKNIIDFNGIKEEK